MSSGSPSGTRASAAVVQPQLAINTTTPEPARRASAEDLGDQMLSHVKAHPGQRGEEIAAALDTDTYAMRPSMNKLIDARDVRTEGKNRGMRYFVGR